MKSEDKTIQDITHGIVAVKRDEKKNEVHVLHFCGYFEEPSAACYDDLRRELEEDPEHGLIGEEFDLIAATPDMIEHVKKSANEDGYLQ